MKLLDSNEIRQLRDVCIFGVNGMEGICSVSQEVSFFVTKSTFVFAWLILYICGFIEYVSGIF